MLKLKTKEVRDLITSTGMTTFEFANKFGFVYESLRRWLNGTRCPKAGNIQKLAKALNCQIKDIYTAPEHLTFDDTDATGIQELTAAVKANTAIMEKLIERLDQIFR